jgi:hypothetical protein
MMGLDRRIADMTGMRFGKLVASDRWVSRHGCRYRECLCDCGTRKEVCESRLRMGKTKSCGCMCGIVGIRKSDWLAAAIIEHQDKFGHLPPRDQPCLPWPWSKTGEGYGGVRFNGKHHRVNRVAYLIAKGLIPPGMDVCHHCDNRLCFNPAHLFCGTRAENMADCHAKGRANCPRGEAARSVLTEKDVRDIRVLVSSGVPTREVGRMFGVTSGHVSRVSRGLFWRHIA